MATKSSENRVVIFTAPRQAARAAKLAAVNVGESEIDAATVRQNVEEFVRLAESLVPASARPGGSRLTEYTIQAGINAKGKVGFLGTGTEVGVTATLTLKFSRQ